MPGGHDLPMPSFLQPDAVRFELRSGEPVLTLAVEVPEGADDGWTLLNRMTLCVVDGPGETGFLFPRIGGPVGTPPGDLAPEGWDDAVDGAGGCTVMFRNGSVFATALG